MHQRSEDRPQRERLESSRQASWKNEAAIYLVLASGSYALFLAGTEASIAWIQWVRSRTANVLTPANPTPAPQTTPQHNPLAVCQMVQAQVQRNHINILTIQGKYHPEQTARDQALQSLRQMGVELPPEPVGMLTASLKKN